MSEINGPVRVEEKIYIGPPRPTMLAIVDAKGEPLKTRAIAAALNSRAALAAEIEAVKQRLALMEEVNRLNAEEARRCFEFDMVVGQAYSRLCTYCAARIAAIDSEDHLETIRLRKEWEAEWERTQQGGGG